MSSPDDAKPYEKMGILLRNWRSARYRSALALFKDAKFSFSYSSYADFERGLTLPSPAALLELAQFFKQDPREALLLWAALQMPTPETRAIFEGTGPAAPLPPESEETQGGAGAPPSFDNTWVFGPSEAVILKRYPWVWEVCMSLIMRYPSEVPFHELKTPKGWTGIQIADEILLPWIQTGELDRTPTGLRMTCQHLFLPRTAAFEEIRKDNLTRATQDLLDTITLDLQQNQKAFRAVTHRPLSPSQIRKWVDQLHKLDNEFKADAYKSDLENWKDETHSLVMMLGPRKITA